MNLNEIFVCPHCSGHSITILGAASLMSDIRVDTLSCDTCGTTWNLYSKVVETNVQIVSLPQEKTTQSVEESND